MSTETLFAPKLICSLRALPVRLLPCTSFVCDLLCPRISLSLARAVHNFIRTATKSGVELREDLGREPTVNELAKHMGVDVSSVRLYSNYPDPLSMETAFGGGSGSSGVAGSGGGDDKSGSGGRHETVSAEGITPEQRAEMFLFQNKLEELLSVLSSDERLVVSLRYGLDGAPPTSIAELADMAGASKYRVQRVESRALNKLRRPARRQQDRLLFPSTTDVASSAEGGSGAEGEGE